MTSYINRALHRARYEKVDDGEFRATVPGLRGVIATGRTLEECRDQLAEVIGDGSSFVLRNDCPYPESAG